MPNQTFGLKTTRGYLPHVRALLLMEEQESIVHDRWTRVRECMFKAFGSPEEVLAEYQNRLEVYQVMQNITGKTGKRFYWPQVFLPPGGAHVEYVATHVDGRLEAGVNVTYSLGSSDSDHTIRCFESVETVRHLGRMLYTKGEKSSFLMRQSKGAVKGRLYEISDRRYIMSSGSGVVVPQIRDGRMP